MDNIEATDKVLSISSQCCLLGISRSQYYYQPSLGRQEKDFKLLVEIKKVQALKKAGTELLEPYLHLQDEADAC